MTLVPRELEQMSGLIDELSVEEVEQIYLPLSRLLNFYVAAAQKLDTVEVDVPRPQGRKVPFILGVAGSVAVGKSTTARVLKALLARWPDHRASISSRPMAFSIPIRSWNAAAS